MADGILCMMIIKRKYLVFIDQVDFSNQFQSLVQNKGHYTKTLETNAGMQKTNNTTKRMGITDQGDMRASIKAITGQKACSLTRYMQ